MKYSLDILFYAFRYSLGRQTYAVDTVVKDLLINWHEINPNTQGLIQKEIKEAIYNKQAGMSCDVEQWKKILELDM